MHSISPSGATASGQQLRASPGAHPHRGAEQNASGPPCHTHPTPPWAFWTAWLTKRPNPGCASDGKPPSHHKHNELFINPQISFLIIIITPTPLSSPPPREETNQTNKGMKPKMLRRAAERTPARSHGSAALRRSPGSAQRSRWQRGREVPASWQSEQLLPLENANCHQSGQHLPTFTCKHQKEKKKTIKKKLRLNFARVQHPVHVK